MKKIFLSFFMAVGVASTGLAQETYTLSDKSVMTIDGSSSLHDWSVNATNLEGSLALDDGVVKSVDFSVAVADIKSDKAAMEKKMHEALKKKEHPKIEFLVEGSNASIGENPELKGSLNIAGVDKEVAIPVTITETDGTLKITGEREIILQDYSIEPPTAMFGTIVVGDAVTVRFELLFSK